MFGNPTAAHYVSEAMHLPVLFVIANNARWAAVHRSTLSTYPKGHAAQAMKQPPFATLEPSPRFEHVIQASGGHGERVSEPKELMPALERALKVVKEEKRQALRQRLPRSELRKDELGRRRLRDGGGKARAAEPTDQRQLDPGAADAEVEAEDVELEAFDAARGETEHAAERELHAAAARRAREDPRAE